MDTGRASRIQPGQIKHKKEDTMNNQTKETQEARTALRYIAVNKINPHPDNPRKELGDLAELSDSIRNNGILQKPDSCPLRGRRNA